MLTAIKPGFAARIEGIDLTGASDEQIAMIRAASLDYPVLVIAGQRLSEDQQIAFAAKFGPIDMNKVATADYSPGARPEFIHVTNISDAKLTEEKLQRRKMLDLGNRFWHTDSSYKPVPCHLSMLYGIAVAEIGGETQFADMRRGYELLPYDLRETIADLVAVHFGTTAREMIGFENWSPTEIEAMTKGAAHRLVRTIPETGRTTVYLSAHASRIEGMSTPEARVLLHELTEIVTQPDNVYTHHWQVGDLVIWDNRCTMHRLRRYDADREKRVLRRVSTLDTAVEVRAPVIVEKAA